MSDFLNRLLLPTRKSNTPRLPVCRFWRSLAWRRTITRYRPAWALWRRAGIVSWRKPQRRDWARRLVVGPKSARRNRKSFPCLGPRSRAVKRGRGKDREGCWRLAGKLGGARQRLRGNSFGATVLNEGDVIQVCKYLRRTAGFSVGVRSKRVA